MHLLNIKIFKIQILISCLGLIVMSCNEPKPEPKKPSYKEIKEPMMEANKRAGKFEKSALERYVKRHDWPNLKETGTGLWISILETNPSGKPIAEGSLVKLNYKVKLLNGETVYKNEKDKPEWVRVGNDQKESGLHEGLTYLREGEKASLAIPSHLAHGLLGDRNKIPMKSSIIYEVEILAVN
jgi:FKBP-type peptidyl-prolyl cis-trans isomerase FkpA